MNGEHHELGLELPKAHEIQRDEDVLSLDLQRELESVGTALGFIAAFALIASQISRAKLLILANASAKAPASPAKKGVSDG